MDFLFSLVVKFLVLLSRFIPFFSKLGICKFEKWEKEKKLKILLVGYNGTRNTGSDVRVSALVKKFENIFGKENIEISILTHSIENFKCYFDRNIKLIEYSDFLFMDLFLACNCNHMAVLCEGSTLKSNFSNILTLIFCQTAGIMKNQNKPCVAYGCEAGEMDNFIKKIVKRMFSDTYFIARTEDSLNIINSLGLEGHIGTDTAWSFDSSSKKRIAHIKLIQSGWDGKKPIIGLALMNPFCWPIRPSITRFIKSVIKNDWEYNFNKLYFFSWSKQRERLFNYYMESIAEAINKFIEKYDFYPIIIGMEALDIKACQKFQEKLRKPAHIFSSIDCNGFEIKEILNRLSILITSRYHARVLSMETNVPAIAISMDERLGSIYKEVGQYDRYYLKVDDMELENKIYSALQQMSDDSEKIKEELEIKKHYYNKKNDEMGEFFYSFVKKSFEGINL